MHNRALNYIKATQAALQDGTEMLPATRALLLEMAAELLAETATPRGAPVRCQFRVEWRASGETATIIGWKSLSTRLGTSQLTLRNALARGKGTAHRLVDDDVVTITQLA